MSVTIQQQPTTPNGTKADLLYVITSDRITELQHQYVADVTYANQAPILSRLRQTASPQGGVTFSLGHILDDYLEYDVNALGETIFESVESAKNFRINFGEEWSQSPSSSVVVYNGLNDSVGNPIVASREISLIKAVNPVNRAINLAVPSGSLTDAPKTQSIIVSKDETAHLTYFSDEVDNLQIQVGSNQYNLDYNIDDAITFTIGVGPEQIYNGLLLEDGASEAANWRFNYQYDIHDHYTVTARSGSTVVDTVRFNLDHCEPKFDTTRFHFINDYGYFDSYTATLVDTQRTTIDRQIYTKPNIDYNVSTQASNRHAGNNNNFIYNRGDVQFFTRYKENKSIHTDWLDDENANWLEQLFYSPSVFREEGTRAEKSFIPIVLTNAEVVSKTNPRGQKLFKYEIQYIEANPKRAI